MTSFGVDAQIIAICECCRAVFNVDLATEFNFPNAVLMVVSHDDRNYFMDGWQNVRLDQRGEKQVHCGNWKRPALHPPARPSPFVV